MRLLYVLFIMFLFTSSYSQIGFKINYTRASYTNVEEQLKRQFDYSESVFKNNFEVGMYYRYQIEGTGFEILPGINYRISPKGNFGLSYQRFVFELPFIVYPMNTEGDCGCPDFSIRNKFFEKHLFFIVLPSFNYEIKTHEKEIISVNYTNMYFKLGIGAGLLVPITDKFSIAPNIIFNWAFNDKWENSIVGDPELKDLSIVYNDISFEIRFNYKFNN